MKKILFIILGITVIIANLSSLSCLAATINTVDINIDGNFADNRVIVVLDNTTSLQLSDDSIDLFLETGYKKISDLTSNTKTEITNAMENIADHLLEGEKLLDYHGIALNKFNRILCLELNTPGKKKVVEAINQLTKTEGVLYACPDYMISVDSVSDARWFSHNDPYDSCYYSLQTIDAQNAWNITTGSNSVRVGVIDTGIDADHEDLSANINTALSRDFTSGTAVPCTPTDPRGHGTHVAGIIGAKGNNSIGICGLAMNVELISLRIVADNGWGYSSNAIKAIDYANANNIDVLNMSLNWHIEDEYGNNQPYVQYYDAVFSHAIENYSGVVVCSAGNEGWDTDESIVYPNNYSLPNLITVAACNYNKEYAVFNDQQASNYGKTTVDIFAPGVDILSTYPEDFYLHMSGTSMAAPYVTGTVALMLSVNPNLLPEEIKYIINEWSSPVDDFTDLCVSGGVLDTYNAVQFAQNHDVTVTYTSNGHVRYCADCGYNGIVPHDFYVYADNGNNGCIIKCVDCNHTINCIHSASYEKNDSLEHCVTCQYGCFSFTEAHTLRYTRVIGDLYSHSVSCTGCDYSYSEGHSWVWNSTTQKYVCTECGYITDEDSVPGIMSLPNPELEAYLASLSGEELEEFIASLPEDQVAHVTALLPSDDEHLTE